MKRSRFILISLITILTLVLLITLEAMWSVGNYRDMRERYEQLALETGRIRLGDEEAQ